MRDPWAIQPGDLLRIQAAERVGAPFLLYRDGQDAQRLLRLDAEFDRITIGRSDSCDVCLDWDERVSRTHAVLERVGEEWAVLDDGLSRNGTFVNGVRVAGRRRLEDRDVVRIGHTSVLFRQPMPGDAGQTAVSRMLEAGDITVAQRRVLTALARPCVEAQGRAAPASNDAIAAELHLSVEAVKAHLRMLFRRFGIEDLAQGQKRMRLVQLAMDSGLAGEGGPRRPDLPTPSAPEV
jgi:FHA domain